MTEKVSRSREKRVLGFLWTAFLFSCVSTLFFLSVNEVNRDLNPDLVKSISSIVVIGTLYGFIISIVHTLPDRVSLKRIE